MNDVLGFSLAKAISVKKSLRKNTKVVTLKAGEISEEAEK
jgi:hypothetical protein